MKLWRILFVMSMILFICSACDDSSTNSLQNGRVSFITYQGKGFTIQYPNNWTPQVASPSLFKDNGGCGFEDSTHTLDLSVFYVSNQGGQISADRIINNMISTNKQSILSFKSLSVQKILTVDGIIWEQQAYSGTDNDGTSIVDGVVGTNYPSKDQNTKFFYIHYSISGNSFEPIYNTYFLPMIKSFRFSK